MKCNGYLKASVNFLILHAYDDMCVDSCALLEKVRSKLGSTHIKATFTIWIGFTYTLPLTPIRTK